MIAVLPGAMAGESSGEGGRVPFALMLALLVWAPVPLASNRGWSQALLAGAVLALLFWVLMAALWHGQVPARRLALARWPVALLAAAAAWAMLQTVVWPAGLLALLSPAAASAWQAANPSGAGAVSLDRGASVAAALHLASLCGLLVLALWTLAGRRRVLVAAAVVVAIGVLEAVLGIAVEIGRVSGAVARGPEEGVGGASGTFVNPNHFAGFLEMTLCVSVGLLLATRGEGLALSGREALSRLLGLAVSPRLLIILAQVVMVTALLWSGSRGAVLALAIALPLVFGLLLPPDAARTGMLARGGMVFGMLGGALAVAVLMGPGTMAEKFAAQGLAGNRLDLVQATLAMGMDFPITGAGAGSFASVFPAYKTPALGLLFYEHAHNDYLQTLAEGGLVGVVLLFGAVGIALATLLRRARARRSRHARAIAGGCAAAVISLLVHGLYDFNLQIPANATLFVFLLGLGLVASAQRSENPGRLL